MVERFRASFCPFLLVATLMHCASKESEQAQENVSTVVTKSPGTDGWGSPISNAYPEAPDPATCFPLNAKAASWRFGLQGYWTGAGIVTWFDKGIFPKYEQPSFLVFKFLAGERNWYGETPPIPLSEIRFGNSSPLAASIETCTVCPVLLTNVWGDNPTAAWFPVSGSLKFSQVDHALNEYVGTLKNVVFKRIGIHGVASFGGWVQAGDPLHPEQPSCVVLEESTFDTRRSLGKACKTEDDCPNSRFHVCSPESGTCVASQCDQGTRFDGNVGKMVPSGTPACPVDKVCELQLDTDDWYYGAHVEHAFTTGSCARACTKGVANTCSTRQVCRETTSVLKGAATSVCAIR